MKKSFKTFKQFGGYEISQLTRKNPSCFNSLVRVKKYKITIEEIIESDDVIKKRIQELYDNCDNHYDKATLKAYGLKYNIKL